MSQQNDGQEKTLPATPKRRADARRKGQVPRSQEVNSALVLLAGALAIQVASAPVVRGVVDVSAMSFARSVAPPVGIPGTVEWLRWTATGAMTAILPLIAIVTATAGLAAGAQAQGVVSTEPLTPKLERIDPIKNAKRIFGWRALMEFGKSLGKLLVVGVAVWLVMRRFLPVLPGLTQQSPYALLALIQSFTVRILAGAGTAYLGIAALDYAFQRWQHEKNLRMSWEELKREQKDTDGDPHVRARRQSMGRSLARRRMMVAASEADLVVTNPTHLAVALKYDPEIAPAPVILAMGSRKTAARIRDVAFAAGVPLVENKPLARALVASGRIGRPVPVELYVAVAEVLAFVYRQRGEHA